MAWVSLASMVVWFTTPMRSRSLITSNPAENLPANSVVKPAASFSPGDKLPVTYVRNGKESTVTVILKNKAGNYDIVKADNILESLGADLVSLDPKKAKEYGVAGGVVVKKINGGALNDQTRMKDGFIILKVNEKNIKNLDEMKLIVGAEKNITISGFYPGYDGIYEYPISLGDQ